MYTYTTRQVVKSKIDISRPVAVAATGIGAGDSPITASEPTVLIPDGGHNYDGHSAVVVTEECI